MIALVLTVSVAGSMAVYARWYRPATLIEELADADLPRIFTAQISIPTRFRPCRMAFTPGQIPSAECPGASQQQLPAALRALERRISVQVDSEDADAIHADVLLDLEADNDPRHSGVTRVIDRLQRLVRHDYRRTESLTDLSASYLVRAGRTQQMLDLVRALETAEQALEIDSKHRPALFNRALALQWLMFDNEAAKAWREYLAVDSSSEIAAEARWYGARLQWQSIAAPSANADDSTLRAFAAASPLEARELGWDTLLGEWGDAVLRHDVGAARSALHRAGVLGNALVSAGRDASLMDEVRLIQAASGDEAAIAQLAEAHRHFAAARREYRRVEYSLADTLFEKASRLSNASPILRRWALAFYGATHRPVDADSSLRVARAAADGVDTLRYPALAGRALWTLGTMLDKSGDGATAAEPLQVAIRLLEGSGEAEYAASATINVLGPRFPSSEAPELYFSAWYAAASKLRSQHDPQALSKAFALLSRRVAESGFPRSARRVNEELAAIAHRRAVKVLVVEAHDYRAEAFARRGDMAAAMKEIAAAEPLLASIDRKAADYFAMMFGGTRGIAEVSRDPRSAKEHLSRAIDGLRTAGVPVRLTALLLARADAYTALGRTDLARVDLLEAIDLIRRGQVRAPAGIGHVAGPNARASLSRLVTRLVAQGLDTDALSLLETGTTALGQAEAEPLPASVPSGTVVLRYGMLGDTLFAWTLAGRDGHVTRTTVPQAEFRDHLRNVLTLLEQREDEEADAELRRLYAWLIRPVEARLGARNSALVIVPDNSMAAVPFSALRDSDGQYLFERFVVSLAGTVAGAARPPPAPDVSSFRAGVVQDPEIDKELYPELDQLKGVSAEVAALSGWTPRTVLSGARARAGSVRGLLGNISLLHFAGHALSDPLVPDSSFLVLASAGSDDLGRLTAADIAAMDLHHLDLAVLSACSTLGGSEAENSGFAGLSGAFLAAGTKGVIGSLWRVNDDRTRELMKRFYAAYRTNRHPAAALRRAQLEMRHSGVPGWDSPSAWAAFEYVGR